MIGAASGVVGDVDGAEAVEDMKMTGVVELATMAGVDGAGELG